MKIFVFSDYIGNCGLQNVDYTILGGQYQIRGIRVPKDWYFKQCFSIILNSTPMIFLSLWIKCEFTIFNFQLNFLVRFDERKIFESCFLMQNP